MSIVFLSQVLKQGIYIKMMCPNYIHVHVYLGASAKMELVIENHVC